MLSMFNEKHPKICNSRDNLKYFHLNLFINLNFCMSILLYCFFKTIACYQKFTVEWLEHSSIRSYADFQATHNKFQNLCDKLQPNRIRVCVFVLSIYPMHTILHVWPLRSALHNEKAVINLLLFCIAKFHIMTKDFLLLLFSSDAWWVQLDEKFIFI